MYVSFVLYYLIRIYNKKDDYKKKDYVRYVTMVLKMKNIL